MTSIILNDGWFYTVDIVNTGMFDLTERDDVPIFNLGILSSQFALPKRIEKDP